MTRSIQHQFFFSHPPETVWDYLTKPEMMALWLMKNNFHPVVGHEFQFKTDPKPNINFDGIFYCKVLELIPFKKLCYSWNSGPGGGKISLESIVTWKLEVRDNGTEVYLDHSGFDKEENLSLYNGLNHGWTVKFQEINKLLNSAS
jgi:uncharacterized protein YndB with AHSA1/START domain